MIVQSHNEWDPIEEIIVGTALHSYAPRFDIGFSTPISPDGVDAASFSGKYPDKIIEETEEDIHKFIDVLVNLNIKVRRPDPPPENNFSTPDWTCDRFFPYSARDALLIVGDNIIETPCVWRSRYFEALSYKSLLIEYMLSGAKWIAAPKPRLLDNIYDQGRNSLQLRLNNDEPVFDAANVLRAGYDIFYLISNSGNEMGMTWLSSILGSDYTIHPISPTVYSSIHIDSTLCLLRPGLILANPERVKDPSMLPRCMQSWDIIFSPEMIEYSHSSIKPLSSKWLGMNMLMLAPDLAAVDARQKPLIKLLEKHHINVVPVMLRHGRTLGGGLHCITLDVKRSGKLEKYF